MRRSLPALMLAMAFLAPAPPASAGQTVTVPGTSLPNPAVTKLSWFGCPSLYATGGAGPRATVGLEGSPLAGRATRLSMPAAGQATGPVSRVASVAAAEWGMSVKSDTGAPGVAHVWYVSSELEQGEVWAGRATLPTAAGAWQRVQPAAATYTWTRYEAATGAVLAKVGTATVDAFAAAHGDGPGFVMAGFGCAAESFALDGIQLGATTYDLEGVPVTTTIGAPTDAVAAGAEVTLTGATRRTSDGRATGAPLVLHSRPAGAGDFAPAPTPAAPVVGTDNTVSVTVAVQEDTDFMWVQPETGYAVPGESPVTTVRVRAAP